MTIKPCPFCRGAGSVDVDRLRQLPFAVMCMCGATGPRSTTEIGATTLWNVRRKENEDVRGTTEDSRGADQQ